MKQGEIAGTSKWVPSTIKDLVLVISDFGIDSRRLGPFEVRERVI